MNNNLLFIGNSRLQSNIFRKIWLKSHLDFWLLIGILVLAIVGFGVLYSASNRNLVLLKHQLMSFGLAFVAMCFFAQIPIYRFKSLVPWLYGVTLLLLFAVIGVGIINKGAQRWLNLGLLRFQPSEIMKLGMPMMLAWYLRDKVFPLHLKDFFVSCVIILLPVLLIAKQPDLGTALLVGATGAFVLLLAGITRKLLVSIITAIVVIMPIVWHFMHDYQKARVFTYLSPESDPYHRGYNIIQSKIAIGSGGIWGKGWLLSSQAYLQYLPEHSTDFIFAVFGEEFGFIGCILLLAIYFYIVGRGLYISMHAQDTFSRLLAGSLILTFFASFFVNIGMVIGVLPVVGMPLPLVSYGGSALVTFMCALGIIMSVQTHRKLIGS